MIDPYCDVAIVGAGPVGLATACTLKVLSKNLSICVFEKREEATRHHPLRIQSDSIDQLVQVLIKSPVQSEAKTALCGQFTEWKDRSIATTEIQDRLNVLAGQLGVRILKGEPAAVKKESFV